MAKEYWSPKARGEIGILPGELDQFSLSVIVINSNCVPKMTETKFQRNTPQRRVILEELQKTSSHPTAAELYAKVRRRLPRISLGTVYRNLDLLAEMGKIQKLDLAGGETRFDGNPEPHCHMRCVRCGRVDDLHEIAVDVVLRGSSDDSGGSGGLG